MPDSPPAKPLEPGPSKPWARANSAAHGLERLARWALPSAILLMGAALVATVWATNRGVENASTTISHGQGSMLFGAIRGGLRYAETPSSELLAELLEQHADDGLLYIALFDRDQLIIDIGEAPPDRAELAVLLAAHPPMSLRRANGHIRVYAGRPRHSDQPPPQPGGARRYDIVIEFEPRVGDELRADARRGLAIGTLAGLALLGLAIAAVRWHLRRAALERQLAHERRLASLGEMSAVLAHEIRNPIASLKGNAQLLAKLTPEDDKRRRKVERLVGESERLERLTNDLLEFARVGEIARAPADPRQLLRSAAERVGGSDRIRFEDDGAPESWSLDGPRILQVLGNLYENALAASPEQIEASCSRERGRLLFEVRDHGEGILPADALHLFEPFFSRKNRGSGLGLAVAHRLVELHGGDISADNHPEGGARFRVSIPSEE